MRSAARQRRNQRWKTRMIVGVGIGADLKQRADERQRAVVDRVFEARSDRERHGPVGHIGRIVDRGPQSGEIAGLERGVDARELAVLCAPICVGVHCQLSAR
jgi:hypothetical protein